MKFSTKLQKKIVLYKNEIESENKPMIWMCYSYRLRNSSYAKVLQAFIMFYSNISIDRKIEASPSEEHWISQDKFSLCNSLEADCCWLV